MRLFRHLSKNRAGLKKESRKKERKNLPLRNREETLVRESDIDPSSSKKKEKRREKKGAAEAGTVSAPSEDTCLPGRKEGLEKGWKRKKKKSIPLKTKKKKEL